MKLPLFDRADNLAATQIRNYSIKAHKILHPTKKTLSLCCIDAY